MRDGILHFLLISTQLLAEKIKNAAGYTGQIVWDTTKPVGTIAKNLDTSKLTQMGWRPKYSLDSGIALAMDWFVDFHKGSDK